MEPEVNNDTFVLIKSTNYYGDTTYQIALHYGDSGSVLAHAPHAPTPQKLAAVLRMMANSIDAETVLTYERTIKYEVVDLPPLPTPIAVGAANRAARDLK